LTLTIEPASDAYLIQCASLLALLFAQEADFGPDLQLQMRGLRQILDDPQRGQILLARDGDQVVGMVSLLWSTSTALGGPVAWLEDMVVAPERRGQGLGRALVQAAVDLGRERGLLRITLLTDGDNHRAQTLYASMGFQPSVMVPMRLLL
jgi:GNAT superfamily N-acetyltransferase